MDRFIWASPGVLYEGHWLCISSMLVLMLTPTLLCVSATWSVLPNKAMDPRCHYQVDAICKTILRCNRRSHPSIVCCLRLGDSVLVTNAARHACGSSGALRLASRCGCVAPPVLMVPQGDSRPAPSLMATAAFPQRGRGRIIPLNRPRL